MSRIRTHNNRRRARALKEGGLYRLAGPLGRYRVGRWSEDPNSDPVADIEWLMTEIGKMPRGGFASGGLVARGDQRPVGVVGHLSRGQCYIGFPPDRTDDMRRTLERINAGSPPGEPPVDVVVYVMDPKA